MKKLFLPYLLLLMPFLSLAQDKPPVLKDAWKKAAGIASSFKINDHLGIMQVALTDTSFELTALDDKMTVLWRDSLAGCGVACGKFKDKILATSDSASDRKGIINPYYAYLVDPASGKVILQKKIFNQKTKDNEQAAIYFASDGSDFKLIVRQADINYGFLSSFKNKTEDLVLISLDENLEPTYQRPKMPDENFVAFTMNRSGDLFLMTTHDQKSLQVRRYEQGSMEPSEPITQVCDYLDKTDLYEALEDITPSGDDRNILYLSIAHDNLDNDREILTTKFNFTTRQLQSTSEVFTHKHVREVEKSYVPFNEYFPTANLGTAKKQIRVKRIAARNGKLITVSAEDFFVTVNGITTWHGYNLMITCYDSDLKTLFRQLMPVEYTRGNGFLTTGYLFGKNDLKIVSNADWWSAYGQLDLTTGKWLKLIQLPPDSGDTDKNIIWFDDNFIIPFLRHRTFGSKYNIDLSLYNY